MRARQSGAKRERARGAPRTVLVTGFPTTFIATRLVRKLASERTDIVVRCVVQEKSRPRADEELARLDPRARDRVELLDGDCAAMDLGLSGREFNALAADVDVIHHAAAVTYLGADRRVAESVNLDGAREILELSEAAEHLERLVFWSTALVSGARRGYVLEEELTAPAGFRNAIEETRYRAERLVRDAASQVPTTILRPAIVVGDSVTGEVDRFDGPYLLVLVMLGSPSELRMPMPGRGDVPLNLVPIDYVVDAGLTIADDPRSLGRTFHIVDPDPQTARQVFEGIARAAGRPVPRGFLPAQVASAILKTPGLDRISHAARAFLEQLATEVVYDDRNTREILGSSGLSCPGFDSYSGTLVDYVRRHRSGQLAARKLKEHAAEEDPFS